MSIHYDDAGREATEENARRYEAYCAARFDDAFHAYSGKCGLGPDLKPGMLAMLKTSPALFEKVYPPVAPAPTEHIAPRESPETHWWIERDGRHVLQGLHVDAIVCWTEANGHGPRRASAVVYVRSYAVHESEHGSIDAAIKAATSAARRACRLRRFEDCDPAMPDDLAEGLRP